MKILFAGGGTGGHVYPAIALAEEFVERGDTVHFVGTKSHVESKIVPDNGFQISFIWISGFQRSLSLKNILFPLKLITSLVQSFFIIKKYQPEMVIGTGGYVSGPVLYMATLLGKKTIIQEQNSFPGVTTRLLNSKVNQVHIAYDDARKYVKNSKQLFLSGNPTRQMDSAKTRLEILSEFKFKDQITISVIGGSLGAKSINIAMSELIRNNIFAECNLIWQTGKLTFDEFKELESSHINVAPFYSNMMNVYSVSDIIICRAGAMTLAEVQNCGIPAIIVPYKYATGNHQYHNAKSLQDTNAAYLIKDDEFLVDHLKKELTTLILNSEKRNIMSKNMNELAKPNATKSIVDHAYKLIKNQ